MDERTFTSQDVGVSNTYDIDFPPIGSYLPCSANDGKRISLVGRDEELSTMEEREIKLVNKFPKRTEAEEINNNAFLASQDDIASTVVKVQSAIAIAKAQMQGAQSAFLEQDVAIVGRTEELLQRLQSLTNMCQPNDKPGEASEDEQNNSFAEEMEEAALLEVNNDDDLGGLFGDSDHLLDMEIETHTSQHVFDKPVVRAASKENYLNKIRNKGAVVDVVSQPRGTECVREPVDNNSVPQQASGTLDSNTPTTTPTCEGSQATPSSFTDTLEPEKIPTSPETLCQELSMLIDCTGEALNTNNEVSVSVVGIEEPEKQKVSDAPPTRRVWVTAETMLRVKRAVVRRGQDYTCTVCQWAGSYKRARLHAKQHYVRYACTCGLMRASRDAVNDHQNSRRKTGQSGHVEVGEIYEIDEHSFTEFADRPEWRGTMTFPDLPPTTTGAEQRNRQAKSERPNSSKGKAPAQKERHRHTSAPEVRVRAIRTPSPPRVSTTATTDLAVHLADTRVRQLLAERDRRAADLIAEAARLDGLALDLYRRSRQHLPHTEDHSALRRQAREMEQEAQHYRTIANNLRGQL
jgi:hypothetical protein